LSFSTIDTEVPEHPLDPDQYQIARRMIHTCADFSIINDLAFSSSAIDSAVAALKQGAPIYTDSNMIRSGLSMMRLRSVCKSYEAGDLHCHVADEDIADQAKKEGLPRAVFAFRKAAPHLENAIVCFGNSPVGLLECNRMIIEEGLRPALVIGMPVGFVHVVESKEELASLDVPFIILKGRRGGSPLTVSVVHALCSLAGVSNDSKKGA
jgi:precorrin isomerase